MKKWISLLLIGAVLLCGCTQRKPELQKPVSFYYLPAEYTFGVTDCIILPELREGSGIDDLKEMLALYLNGPVDPAFHSPFPVGTKLLELEQTDDTLHLTLSDSFASLQGHRLTLACAAITKTCLELTSCVNIQIRAETAALDGQKFIEMNASSLLLLDNAEP
jgi:hypothetical protein